MYFLWVSGVVSPGLTDAVGFRWRLSRTGSSRMTSVTCPAAGAGCQLRHLSSPVCGLPRSSKPAWLPYVAISGRCSQRGKHKLEGLSRAWGPELVQHSFLPYSIGHSKSHSSPDSKEWRNMLHFWPGREAKSHYKRACTMEWKESVAFKGFTTL